MPVENIIPFKEKFESVVSNILTDEMMLPRIEIDININFNQINPKNV